MDIFLAFKYLHLLPLFCFFLWPILSDKPVSALHPPIIIIIIIPTSAATPSHNKNWPLPTALHTSLIPWLTWVELSSYTIESSKIQMNFSIFFLLTFFSLEQQFYYVSVSLSLVYEHQTHIFSLSYSPSLKAIVQDYSMQLLNFDLHMSSSHTQMICIFLSLFLFPTSFWFYFLI